MKKTLTLLLFIIMLFAISGCEESHRRTRVTVITHGYIGHHCNHFCSHYRIVHRPIVVHRSTVHHSPIIVHKSHGSRGRSYSRGRGSSYGRHR